MDKKRIPIGLDDFKRLIEDNYYYVDKTAVIEELLNTGSLINLFPRPRRFGKSLLMSMLDNFFDIDKKEANKDLFEGLHIESSKYYSELNSYPVIYLDFKRLKQDTYEEFYDNFKDMIAKLCVQKKYVTEVLEDSERKTFDLLEYKNGSFSDYQYAINNLSVWLERYYKRQVIILIDEYDAPISNAYVKGIYEEEMNLLRNVFSSTFKGNTSLKMGILTGVLRVSGESLFSDFNNVNIFDIMTSHYNEYFGFTEKETKRLLEYYELALTNEVKEYYDGYSFGGLSIYNPWSILNYAEKKTLQDYWVNTSSNALIKQTLNELSPIDKEKIEKLIIGESINFNYNQTLTYQDFNIQGNINNLLNLLLFSGYLTFDYVEYDEYNMPINYYKVPNEEVKSGLMSIIQSVSFGSTIDVNELRSFRIAVLNGDKESIEKYLNEKLACASYYDTKEMFYHGYMLGLFAGFPSSAFIIKSNREAGSGRYDMMIESINRDFGAIIEFKVASSKEEMESIAHNAKKQIAEKEYYQELILDKVKTIYEYVIVFYDKECIVR